MFVPVEYRVSALFRAQRSRTLPPPLRPLHSLAVAAVHRRCSRRLGADKSHIGKCRGAIIRNRAAAMVKGAHHRAVANEQAQKSPGSRSKKDDKGMSTRTMWSATLATHAALQLSSLISPLTTPSPRSTRTQDRWRFCFLVRWCTRGKSVLSMPLFQRQRICFLFCAACDAISVPVCHNPVFCLIFFFQLKWIHTMFTGQTITEAD